MNIQIPYPQLHIGTEKTTIQFYDDFDKLTAAILSSSNKKVYVVDDTVCNLPSVKAMLEKIDENSIVVVLGSGEPYKTVECVLEIITKALQSDMQRNSTFVGIGGGVICDITAFAASIFKRGAKLELIPTTLLAMVDASIGGKTGCDFNNYKNMVGTFYPANTLYFCADFVQSQSDLEYLSGLAEVVKTAMLYDAELFALMKNEKDAILARKKDIVSDMIYRCAKAKANIVEKDLTEQNIRMQLNLGHTFGHALEAIAGLGTITHGEAVAWGISRAIALSVTLGLCSEDYKTEIFAVLEDYGYCTKQIHDVVLTKEKVGEKILAAMKKDKKNSSSTVRFVIQKALCNTVIQEVEDSVILGNL